MSGQYGMVTPLGSGVRDSVGSHGSGSKGRSINSFGRKSKQNSVLGRRYASIDATNAHNSYEPINLPLEMSELLQSKADK